MKKRLLFCALLLAHAAFGQDAYFKSSIVTLRNDTIKGFVSNIYDSKSFKFKKKPSDKPTIYTPQQLKSVVLDGNTFESKAINVPYYKMSSIDGWGSANASAVTGLVRNTEKGRLVDTVFIQKLVKGTVSLYKMTSLGGTAYYFAEKLGVFKEIPPLHYVLTTSSKGQKSEELQPSLSYGGGPFDLSLFVYKKRNI